MLQHQSEAQSKILHQLSGLDSLIENARWPSGQETENVALQMERAFCQSLYSSLRGDATSDLPDPVEAVFGLTDVQTKKQLSDLMASSLLRLMAVCDGLFSGGTPFAIGALAVLDALPERELYASAGVHRNDQTYKKIEKLRLIIPALEDKAQRVIDSYTGLQTMKDTMENLLRLLRSSNSFPIQAFSPETTDQLMRAAVSDSLDYLDADGRECVPCYDGARASIEELIDTCKDFGTRYSTALFERFGRLTLQYVEERFAESPVGKSADVRVRVGGKRYPFQDQSVQVELAFTVENHGPGVAYGVRLALETNSDVKVKKPSQFLGNIEPNQPILVRFDSTVESASEICATTLTASWSNFDSTDNSSVVEFELKGQERKVDWDELDRAEPYSLEPVDSKEDLVGRDMVLKDLLKRSRAPSVGSSYLHGQKRVGKTSVARTLQTLLRQPKNQERVVVLLEAGQFVTADATTTINSMGEAICRAILGSDPRLTNLTIPEFKGALAPLNIFLEDVQALVPEMRVLVILDEFDELPPDLYKQSGIANAFFQTLRAISSSPRYGIILVGGENLQYIVNEQGARLNKFKSVPLSYLDRSTQWSDFCDLVRRPVAAWLEITDEAVDAIWNITDGHPYYTKMLCQPLFTMMVERRDGHVTDLEVSEANAVLISTLDTPAFQHFWDDGVAPNNPGLASIRLLRKRILLAMARSGRHPVQMSTDEIVKGVMDQTTAYSKSQIEGEISELCRREVLVESNDILRCRVSLLSEWLVKGGARQILITFDDQTKEDENRLREEEAEVRSDEVLALVEPWDSYRGRKITADHVRQWLGQFGSKANQRLAFYILRSVKFYGRPQIREKLREAHGIVSRNTRRVIDSDKRRRRDILVSYLGGVGKSGAEYASLYADENQIVQANVVEREKLRGALKKAGRVSALVFVDDFVGTGGSVKNALIDLDKEVVRKLRHGEVPVYFVAVAGFHEAMSKLEDVATGLDIDLTINFCDVLDKTDRAFAEDGHVFPDDLTREEARKLAVRHGSELVKNNPLGFSRGEALVVFETGCPNNSLPILWKGSPAWKPLFPRL